METACLPSPSAPRVWLAHSRTGSARGPMREGMGEGTGGPADGTGALRITPLEILPGARVLGLDAALPLTAVQLQALREALGLHAVLLGYGRPLDAAGLADLAHRVGEAFACEGAPGSLLYVGAVPRAGGDAVWLQLADACELLGAGTRRHVGDVELTTFNPYLHRLRLRAAE